MVALCSFLAVRRLYLFLVYDDEHMSVKDADKLFSDAIQLELDGHYDNAFNSYLNVAHLYLSARRLVSGQQDIDCG